MLARRARTSKSWDHVFNFRTCDVALSSLITFNRADASTCATRRRAFGAVGPSRTNDLTYSGVFSDAAWTKTNVTLTAGVADPRGGTTAFTLTAGASAPRQLTQALSAGASLERVNSLWLRRRTGAGNVNLWSPDVGTPLVISALPSTWTRYEVANASASTTRTLLLELTVTGDEVDIWEGQLELGRSATPNIPTTSAPVTTTDWPRTNKCSNFNDASSLAGLTLFNEPAAVLSISDDRAALTVAGLAHLCGGRAFKVDNTAGVAIAYVAISGATGNLADHTGSMMLRGSGTVILRGDYNTGADSPQVLTDSYRRCVYRQARGIGGSKNVGDTLQLGVPPGAVAFFVLNQWEEGDEASAVIPVRGAPVTVNTPPAGQMITVAANVPPLEYDKDGIGRGLRVDGAATQLLSTTKGFKGGWHNNGPMTGWVDNYGVAPDGTVSTTFAPYNSTAYELVSATIGVPLKFSVHVRTGTAPYYRLHADGVAIGGGAYIDRTFGTNAAVNTFGPVTASGVDGDAVDGMQRVWFEVTPTATGILAFHIYPISGTAEFWGANVTTGNLTGYIEGQHTRAAASALMVPSAVGLTPTSGTLLIDCEVSDADAYLLQIGSGGLDRLLVARDNANLRVYCVRDGSEQLGSVWIGAPFSGGNRARVAIAWAPGKIYACVNGGEPSIFNASMPLALSELALGHYPSGVGYHINGLIHELRTTSRTLTIAELVRETAL